MERWLRAQEREPRIVIGLNSGTSMDGIDAVVVRFQGRGLTSTFEVLAFTMVPFEREFRDRILCAPALSCEDVCRLNKRLGTLLSEAARAIASLAGIPLASVDLIASHGQTVCHLPEDNGTSTLQIGDLDVIGAETGCLTVGDFRAADVAAGGGGAPLMPYLDARLFQSHPGTVTLNLGGITSLTWCPGDLASVLAFDVGPCNVTLDLLAAWASGGNLREDTGGQLAKSGRVDLPLLEMLLGHPFFKLAPPKTTGREQFGGEYVTCLKREFPSIQPVDLLATHTRLVGESIRRSAEAWIPGGMRAVHQVVASGGGVHNDALMEGIQHACAPVRVRTIREFGLDPDAKEALLFALLGHDRLFGLPTNLPNVTGAKRAVSLGKVAGEW